MSIENLYGFYKLIKLDTIQKTQIKKTQQKHFINKKNYTKKTENY